MRLLLNVVVAIALLLIYDALPCDAKTFVVQPEDTNTVPLVQNGLIRYLTFSIHETEKRSVETLCRMACAQEKGEGDECS